MKEYIHGYEALAVATLDSGVCNFVLENNIYTDLVRDYLTDEYRDGPGSDQLKIMQGRIPAVICRAAERDTDSGGVLTVMMDADIGNIRYSEVHAATVHVLLSAKYRNSIISYARSERLTMFLPSSVEEIRSMVEDAFFYSYVIKAPVLVLLRADLMEAGGIVECYKPASRKCIRLRSIRTLNERRRIKNDIEAQYNRISGAGNVRIAGCGIHVDKAIDIAGSAGGISFMRINMITDNTEKKVNSFVSDAKVNAGFGDSLKLEQLFRETEENRLDEEIRYFLSSKIPREKKRLLMNVGEREEVIMPHIPEKKTVMCPGCIYRIEGDEEIYCVRRDCYVVNGKKKVTEYYDRELIKKSEIYECVVREKRTAYVSFSCDGCTTCIEETGCPAIWKRGFKIRIDPYMCTGCGLCIETCEKGAILWRASCYADSTEGKLKHMP